MTKVKSDSHGCSPKLSILLYRELPHQKNGLDFCQKSSGVIRCSLATYVMRVGVGWCLNEDLVIGFANPINTLFL